MPGSPPKSAEWIVLLSQLVNSTSNWEPALECECCVATSCCSQLLSPASGHVSGEHGGCRAESQRRGQVVTGMRVKNESPGMTHWGRHCCHFRMGLPRRNGLQRQPSLFLGQRETLSEARVVLPRGSPGMLALPGVF